MDSIIAFVFTTVALLTGANFPQILGTTDGNVTYPYTFQTSGFTCDEYQQCWDYCRDTFETGGTGDAWECQQHWPSANTSNTGNATDPYPFTFTESGFTCPDYQVCWDHCRMVFVYDKPQDKDQCRDLYPDAEENLPTPPSGGNETDPPPQENSPTQNFTKEMEPGFVELRSEETVQFTLVNVFDDGSRYPDEHDQVTWQVINGGGQINSLGVFRAGPNPGLYDNTVKGEAYGKQATATVRVKPRPSPTPSPTPTGGDDDSSDDDSSADDAASDNTSGDSGGTAGLPDDTTGGPEEEEQPEPTYMFQNVNQLVDECLKSSFSESEYWRYFAPNGPRADLNQLGTRISIAQECMKLKKVPDFDQETEACLRKELGYTRFLALYSKNEQPTDAEKKKVSVCFNKPNIVNYSAAAELDAVTLSCLKLYIGGPRYEKLQSGSVRPTADEISLGRECLNVKTDVVSPPLIIETPPEQVSCLEKAVGKERFEAISSGKDQPTASESEAANECFGTDTTVQSLLLPAPPEQVAFIPESSEDVVIDRVTANNRDDTNILKLSGRGLPNSVVDVYIFSDPIVVTTSTDENGDWSYELAYHVPEGEHQAYTVIRHPEKGLIRSEVFSIDVAYAQEGVAEFPEALIVNPVQADSQRSYLLAALAIMMVGVGGMFLIFRSKLALLATTPESSPETEKPSN